MGRCDGVGPDENIRLGGQRMVWCSPSTWLLFPRTPLYVQFQLELAKGRTCVRFKGRSEAVPTALLRTFCISSRDGQMQRGWASPWHLCSPPLKSSHLLASWLTIASSPLQASLVAKMAKNLPAVQEARVWSLGQEDTLEKGKAAAFLPGEFHGQRSLSGYSPWGWKELDITARLSTHIQTHS